MYCCYCISAHFWSLKRVSFIEISSDSQSSLYGYYNHLCFWFDNHVSLQEVCGECVCARVKLISLCLSCCSLTGSAQDAVRRHQSHAEEGVRPRTH